MPDEVVDLVSDDDPITLFAPPRPTFSPSPPPASPPRPSTRSALHLTAMFDDDSDHAHSPPHPFPPALPAAPPDPILLDLSDESDDEIHALVQLPSTSPRRPRPRPRPVPHPRVEALPPLSTAAELVPDDDDKENEHASAIDARLDPESAAFSSLEEDAVVRPGAQPALSRKEMMDLVKLNSLSSDATAELPTPAEMNVVLLKHQRQALAWMRERERDDMPPGHPRGGILADDQGFGKTLSVIALMLTNKPPIKPGAIASPAWGTLVICPTSIMHQWAGELQNRIDSPYKPRVLVYHGAKRPRDPYVLVKYDVIITSYGMARQEFPKVLTRDEHRQPLTRRRKGPLYKLKWFRVILDEAQAIKNHHGETFQACTLLQSDRRWSLSGTPIQNTIDDIYSQFLFIRYFLVSSYKEWKMRYKRPLESSRGGSKENLFKQFQAKLGVVLLRRAKSDKIDGQPVIKLPKRTVVMRELKFSTAERAYYNAQEVRAVVDMNRFGIEQGFTTALVILLRLRQACGHPALCDWNGDRQFDFSDSELDSVEERMKTRCIYHLLPSDTRARLSVELGPGTEVAQNCPICMEAVEDDGIVTKCGHIFCTSDFQEWNRENETCPSCRADIGGENDKMSLREVREEIHAIDRANKRKEEQKVARIKAKSEPRVKIEITIGDKRSESPSSSDSPTKRRCKDETMITHTKAEPLQEELVEPDEVRNEDEINNKIKNEDETMNELDASKIQSSTKILAFLSEYKTIHETTDDKVLCYSQWTRMLDLVEEQVVEQGYEFVRLDGSMTPGARGQAIQEFNKRSKCRLFLISLQAGSTGLNLTVANRIFLLDSWWNPTVEEQAIDRAHRIGQTKDVEVVRLKIENSVEDRILALQEKKRALINGTLGVEGLKMIGRQRLTFQDVLGLFSDVASNVAARAGLEQNHEMQDMAEGLQMMTRNMRL